MSCSARPESLSLGLINEGGRAGSFGRRQSFVERASNAEGVWQSHGSLAAKIPRAASTGVAALLIAGLVATNLTSSVVALDLLSGTATVAVAPLFLIWFNVSFDTACFASWWLCLRYGSADGVGAPGVYAHRTVAWYGAVLCAVYQLGNWLYFVGLQVMSVTVAMIFYQSSSAWVLLLSVLLLPGEVWKWRRAGAVLICLLGVALVALDNWDSSSNAVLGVCAMLSSSVLWALYEVLLKRWLGDANVADSFLFVGYRGLWNLLLGWPVLLLSGAAGFDVWPDAGLPVGQRHEWGGLVFMAWLSVALTLLITLGIAWTSPMFVRIGSMLTVPASVLVLDLAWHHRDVGWPCLLGAGYVLLGFALLGWRTEKDGDGDDDDEDGCGDAAAAASAAASSLLAGSRHGKARWCRARHDLWMWVVLVGGVAMIVVRAVKGAD